MVRRSGFLIVVAVLILVGAVRLRLLDLPLERDEGEYAYAGQLILAGVPPYKLVYNMKFPGTYAVYALIMLIFGQTPAGIHLGLTCVTTGTALMLYWLGRRILDETAGVVTAVTYAVLAASPALLGLAAHATHFAALFTTAGLCTLWLTRHRLSKRGVAVSGFMFGLAILMKQHATLVCLWGVWFVWRASRQAEMSLADSLRLLLWFCAGAVAPVIVCCVVLWYGGVFDQFVFWAIRYAFEYARVEPVHKAPQYFLEALGKVGERDWLMWLTVFVAFGLVFTDSRLRKDRLNLLMLCLAAFLTTVPGFYFRRHYFILAVPAAALLTGCGVSAARAFLTSSRYAACRVLPVLGYGMVTVFTVIQHSDIWFQATPLQATRRMYLGNPFAESQQIADFIRTNSMPDAKIAILGSEPQIFFLSQRRSATGYIYTYPLVEPHPYADRMQTQMIQEIESAKPEFVLFVGIPLSWLARPESNTRIIEWWSNVYRTNYALVGVVLMDPIAETQFLWGKSAVDFGEQPHWGVWIYRRRTP